jgi:AraC family transcriptional regulator of adaptative response / DNA-3-methyladenine glycosylase II
MRALGDPDAHLPTDIGVRHGLAAAGAPDAVDTAGWRPWRSYAVHHLWVAATEADKQKQPQKQIQNQN